MEERGHLRYPTTSSQREVVIMSMPNMVRQDSMIFGSACVELMDVEKASILRVLVLAEGLWGDQKSPPPT
jgi:hypothetical protein